MLQDLLAANFAMMILVIVGNVDPVQVRELILSAFANVPVGGLSPQPTINEPPQFEARKAQRRYQLSRRFLVQD